MEELAFSTEESIKYDIQPPLLWVTQFGVADRTLAVCPLPWSLYSIRQGAGQSCNVDNRRGKQCSLLGFGCSCLCSPVTDSGEIAAPPVTVSTLCVASAWRISCIFAIFATLASDHSWALKSRKQ